MSIPAKKNEKFLKYIVSMTTHDSKTLFGFLLVVKIQCQILSNTNHHKQFCFTSIILLYHGVVCDYIQTHKDKVRVNLKLRTSSPRRVVASLSIGITS